MCGKKFKIETVGCRTNQYESEVYANQLFSLGYSEAKEGEQADLCIVNSCTVTSSADRSSRLQIRRLHRFHPFARLVVTGCLVEREREEIKKMEGVSDLVSNQEKEELLNRVLSEEIAPFHVTYFSRRTRALVKIQDGCNSFCSYCIIPYVRGRSRSRRVDEIIKEITLLVHNGHKEIVITGVDIGDFKGDQGERLSDLIRKIDQVEGIGRVRLSSIDPDSVDDELIDAIVMSKSICHSLHLSIQSGSNLQLKRMGRKYSRQQVLDLVARLRERSPDFGLTADLIVGFPGEREVDFQDTLQLLREIRCFKVHIFPFSARAGTVAARMTDSLPCSLIEERRKRLLSEAEAVAYEVRNGYIGKRATLLVESGGRSFGYTEHGIPLFCSTPVEENSFLLVECTHNLREAVQGRAIS